MRADLDYQGHGSTIEPSTQRGEPQTKRTATSKRHELQQQKKNDFYKEMDMSMDMQLHPLKDSTWTEILPFVRYFQFGSAATQDTLSVRESRS